MSQFDLARLRAANTQLAAMRLPGSQAPDNGELGDPDKSRSWLNALATGVQNPIPIEQNVEQAQRPSIATNGTMTFHPDIGLALLRTEKAAIGRIWLLLRHCDVAGKGWIPVAEARALLTKKESPLRVCGWRQLRNLLRAGQGVFWERDKERIWLRSVAKVAVALGVERLENRPIALPITALLDGIGAVRSHFYASFHSGRHDPDCAKPIARDTLSTLSGVGRDSQRRYERQTGTIAQSNFAIGHVATDDARKAACWEHGNHVFTLTDAQGQHGERGKKYLAWQLPNSYHATHDQTSRSVKRRINRQLADLLTQRATGNDEQVPMRHYFATGAAAVKAKTSTRYLQTVTSGATQLWRCL